MLLPGLWVAFLALLLALALRRWYDPVPLRCWLAWGAALAVLLGAVLLGGRTLLPVGQLGQVPPFQGALGGEAPGDPLWADLTFQIAPWLERVRASYASGAWPLWNGLSGAGEPLLANPQSQALQPLVALALPFPVAAGLGVTAALRVLVALVFTWLLLRRQGISEMAALAGSLAWGLGGFVQLWLGWPIAGSAALLPAVLYGIVLMDERGERRDAVLLALATAALLLVGHPETALHAALLAGAFTLSRLLARPRGERGRRLGALALAAAVGAGLAAPLALPAAEHLPASLRAAQLRVRHETWRATGRVEAPGDTDVTPVERLLPSAAPNALGNSRYGAYWGSLNTIEDAAGFAGTAALLAALTTVWPRQSRFPQERLMQGTALACLAVVARPAPLAWLLEALPILRQSQTYHSRVNLLLGFAVAYLAACAWERWRRGGLPARRLLPAAAALALLIGWAYLAHPEPGKATLNGLWYGSLALQLAALAVSALLLAGPGSTVRAAAVAAVAAAELLVFHVPAHPAAPASLYYPVPPPIAFLQERLDPWHRVAGLGLRLRPNLASVYGLADLRNANAAKPAAVQEAMRPINPFPLRPTEGLQAPDDPLYPRLGVRFLLTPPRTFLAEPWHLAFRQGGEAWVYRNPEALPLLFLPGGDLDLGTLEPERMRARARLPGPALLDSSVYQDGNWKLLLDGARRPTARTSTPFVAAWLPAGEVEIDLLYRPGSFAAGLAVAALALAVGAAFWAAPQTAERSQAWITPSS